MTPIGKLDTEQDVGRFVAEYLEGNPLPMSAIDGLSTAAQPSPWTPLTLVSSWAELGEGSAPPSWRTVAGGALVQLRGIVKIAIPISTLFGVAALPAAVLPAFAHNFIVQDSIGGYSYAQTRANGELVRAGTASESGTAAFVLDSIIYPVDG